MPAKSKATDVESEDIEGHAQITLKEPQKDGSKRTYVMRTDEFGPADDMACRQQTGLPLEHYLQNFGLDSVVVMVWMARRKSGEPNLAFQSVMSKYPTWKALEAIDCDIKPLSEVKDDEGPLADES